MSLFARFGKAPEPHEPTHMYNVEFDPENGRQVVGCAECGKTMDVDQGFIRHGTFFCRGSDGTTYRVVGLHGETVTGDLEGLRPSHELLMLIQQFLRREVMQAQTFERILELSVFGKGAIDDGEGG